MIRDTFSRRLPVDPDQALRAAERIAASPPARGWRFAVARVVRMGEWLTAKWYRLAALSCAEAIGVAALIVLLQ